MCANHDDSSSYTLYRKTVGNAAKRNFIGRRMSAMWEEGGQMKCAMWGTTHIYCWVEYHPPLRDQWDCGGDHPLFKIAPRVGSLDSVGAGCRKLIATVHWITLNLLIWIDRVIIVGKVQQEPFLMFLAYSGQWHWYMDFDWVGHMVMAIVCIICGHVDVWEEDWKKLLSPAIRCVGQLILNSLQTHVCLGFSLGILARFEIVNMLIGLVQSVPRTTTVFGAKIPCFVVVLSSHIWVLQDFSILSW